MNNPLISIIVPVYNVEEYLADCLNSIVKQKFTDYEVILVDDGSTDSSADICDDYAKRFHFSVIHQLNGGLSAARNTGINAAEGEYLLFVDSDDFLIGENALMRISESVLEYQPDLLICLPDEYDESGDHVIYHHNSGIWSEDRLYQGNAIVDPLYSVNGIWVTLAQTKIIRRKFCMDHGLMFCKGIYHEDDEWIARVLLSDPGISFLYKPWYGYRHRENSIVSSADDQKRYKRTCDKIKVASSTLNHPMAKKYKELIRYAADYLLNTMISANRFSDNQIAEFADYLEAYKKCYKRIFYSKDIKLILKTLYIMIFGEERFIYKYRGKIDA